MSYSNEQLEATKIEVRNWMENHMYSHGGSSMITEDFGPQRWCKECNSRVEEFEPEIVKTTVEYWHFGVNELFQGMKKSKRSMLPTYREHTLEGWKCPNCGILSDDEVKLIETEEVYEPMAKSMDITKFVIRNRKFVGLDIDALKDAKLDRKTAKWIYENRFNLIKLSMEDNNDKEVSGLSYSDEILTPSRDVVYIQPSKKEEDFWKNIAHLVTTNPRHAYNKVKKIMSTESNPIEIGDNEVEYFEELASSQYDYKVIKFSTCAAYSKPGLKMYNVVVICNGVRLDFSRREDCNRWIVEGKVPAEHI